MNPKSKTLWRNRKIVINLTLIHSLFIICYLTFAGAGESNLHETIASYTLILIYATLGGYIFGVVTDGNINGTYDRTPINTDNGLGTWKTRRRMIFASLLATTLIIDYLLWFGEDTTLNSTIASGLCLLHGAIINGYVFGAIFDKTDIESVLIK